MHHGHTSLVFQLPAAVPPLACEYITLLQPHREGPHLFVSSAISDDAEV